MERIAYKLKRKLYDNIDEIAADFMLMFENACKYNEPDSQIYKDAMLLKQICIQTEQQLRDVDDVPDPSITPTRVRNSINLEFLNTFELVENN